MARAVDVAQAVLTRTGPIDTIKLQKLVYYCQAWALAWRDEPLFPEPVEAWRDGPVVQELFRRHKGARTVGEASFPGADARRLPAWGSQVVAFVCAYYGRMTGAELRNRTHEEAPWAEARRTAGLSDGD